MTSYVLWEEDDKVSLCDVSRRDGEDVRVREFIQDVQLVSCIVFPNLQWDEFCCVRLLSGIVEALVDSPILTPEGEGEVGGRIKRERDEREERGSEKRDRRESLLEQSTLNNNSYVEVNSTHPHTVVKSHESHMTTHTPPNLLQQLVAMLKRIQEEVGLH